MWSFIENGIKKTFSWGYSEIFMPPQDCFTDEETLQVVDELSELRADVITNDEKALLTKLKVRRSELRRRNP